MPPEPVPLIWSSPDQNFSMFPGGASGSSATTRTRASRGQAANIVLPMVATRSPGCTPSFRKPSATCHSTSRDAACSGTKSCKVAYAAFAAEGKYRRYENEDYPNTNCRKQPSRFFCHRKPNGSKEAKHDYGNKRREVARLDID